MTRLLIILLLLVSVAWSSSDSGFEAAEDINNLMEFYYNTDRISNLVRELFHADATLEIKRYSVIAKGHAEIEALLKDTHIGRIERIKIVDVVNVSENDQHISYKVTAEMIYKMKKYGNEVIDLEEVIIKENSEMLFKFDSFIQEHQV